MAHFPQNRAVVTPMCLSIFFLSMFSFMRFYSARYLHFLYFAVNSIILFCAIVMLLLDLFHVYYFAFDSLPLWWWFRLILLFYIVLFDIVFKIFFSLFCFSFLRCVPKYNRPCCHQIRPYVPTFPHVRLPHYDTNNVRDVIDHWKSLSHFTERPQVTALSLVMGHFKLLTSRAALNSLQQYASQLHTPEFGSLHMTK